MTTSLQSKLVVVSDKKALTLGIQKSLNSLFTECLVLPFDRLLARMPHESPDCLLIASEENKKLTPDFIREIKHFDDNLPIIIATPSKNVNEVVRLMKMGIYDYFPFPIDFARLQMSVANAMRLYQLVKKIFLLENQLGRQSKLEEMVGQSPTMQTIFQTIQNVAKTNATVLITGESGTGKELVAKAIHHLSPRAERRFIDINCGAIPRELLENELFGHERGAYTGADKRYVGCCERADGGTLFLDEISEMEISLQVKLLRFLQERQFSRVGGSQPIKVDVRIIAATNRDLPELVEASKFREDLFYRLNVVLISIPPLRERKEDIPLLAKYFLDRYSQKNEKIFLDFTPEAMERLSTYPWPGNIRELENSIERAVVLHNDTKVKFQHLPESIQNGVVPAGPNTPQKPFEKGKILPLTLVERYAIEAALKECTGNVPLAAKRLQIGQATLYRKIKQFGIRP